MYKAELKHDLPIESRSVSFKYILQADTEMNINASEQNTVSVAWKS
jgi:hypothetical protein